MSVRKRGQSNGHPNGSTKPLQKIDDARTDPYRWRLRNDRGVQTWHYLQTDEEVKQWPITVADKHYLGLGTVCEERGPAQ